MALEIFKLVGSVFVDTEEANKSISKTDEHAEGLGKKLLNGIGTAGKWAMGMVTAAGTTATALGKVATDAAATTDEIDKMSQRLGISRSAYQELEFALAQSGVDINSFQTGMKALLKNMDAVTEGNATAIENFDKLGVSVQNTDGSLRSQEDVLFDVIAAFQAMEDSSEKSRLAQELFGKQGQEIIPLLNSEAESIEAMRKEAHDLGLVLSDEAIDSGVLFTDTLDKLKRSAATLGTGIGASLMPILIDLMNMMLDSMPQLQNAVASLAPVLMGLMESFVPLIADLASTLLPGIIDLINLAVPLFTQIVNIILPPILELLTAILPALIQIAGAVLPALVSILNVLTPLFDLVIALLTPIIQLFTELVAPIIALIAEAISPLIEIIALLIGSQLQPLIEIVKLVGTIFGSTLKGVLSTVTGIIDKVIGVFKGLSTFLKGVFTGDWKMAFQGIADIISNIMGGISEFVKAPINLIIDLLNGFIDGINKIQIPDWVPGLGGKGLNLSHINKLYNGGMTGSGQLISTNEREPEIVGNYGSRTLVVNNAQIIETMISAISQTMERYIDKLMQVYDGAGGQTGDIIIPIYLNAGEKLEELIINAKERIVKRSGGHAYV